MRYEFEQIGLQHILGVSGFHFAILAFVCSAALSCFLKQGPKWIAQLFLLNAYYLFLGSSPAVLRCYLMATAYLAGKLLHRSTNGLNLLGFTLSLEVLLTPPVIANIGFQLTFASCFAIFLYRPFFDRHLSRLLPKRTQTQALSLSILAKHGHLIAHFLKNSLSVGLAVNLTLLPILFYHFHYFPLISLFYNLFYPFFADLLLFILLLASLLHLLSPLLASPLFFVVGWLAVKLLELASYYPPQLQSALFFSNLSAWPIPIYLFFLLAFALSRFSKIFENQT